MTSSTAVVPVPLRCEALGGGRFVIGPATSVVVGDSPEEIAVGYLAADLLGRLASCPVALVVGADGAEAVDDVVVLRLAAPAGGAGRADARGAPGLDVPRADERYRLRVEPGRVRVEGASATAIVRGLATLGQLLGPDVDGVVGAPAVLVDDAPRYAWRGLDLDVPGLSLDAADLAVLVPLLAAYKLNVLRVDLDAHRRGELAAFAGLHGVTLVGSGASGGRDHAVLRHHDDACDVAPLVAAALAGARVVLSPEAHTRLDRRTDVQRCYAWDPAAHVRGLPADAVVGVEATLRAPGVRDVDELTAVLLPRLAAVAEVGWSPPQRRDWSGFRARLARHGTHWERAGLEWTPSPDVAWLAAERSSGSVP